MRAPLHLLGFLLAACLQVSAETADLASARHRPAIAADYVETWEKIIADRVASAALPVHVEARVCAMTYLAIERAIIGQPAGLSPAAHDLELDQFAALAAVREVLERAVPLVGSHSEAAAARVHAAAAVSFEERRAAEAGRTAATKILAERENDHWADAGDSALAPLQVVNPFGDAVPDDAARAHWLAAAPFALKSAAQFSARLPHWRDLSGDLQPDTLIVRARIFDHVDRTLPPAVLARTWNGSPVAAWNHLAHRMVAGAGFDLARSAHVLAIVNVAMADATLAVLHEQSRLGRWQTSWSERWARTDEPATPADVVVDARNTDEQQVYRASTRSSISAPLRNYPALPAAIAAAANAALAVMPRLESIACELQAEPTAGDDTPSSRRFASSDDAARECAFAASLDGRTSREACVAGYDLGGQIGRYVLKHFRSSPR